MNPSEHRKQKPQPSPSSKSSKILPGTILFLLLALAGGALFYFNSPSSPPEPSEPLQQENAGQGNLPEIDSRDTSDTPSPEEQSPGAHVSLHSDNPESDGLQGPGDETKRDQQSSEDDIRQSADTDATPPSQDNSIAKQSSCTKPSEELGLFYSHLDAQPYMAQYGLSNSSRKHFEELVKKLLANPPQVTRESDDLYAILKNTAHFFRVSGKDNIRMLKGMLEKEKDSLEQILADYHHLVTTADCRQGTYVSHINDDPLYEYACFFLNTMGGRLYLFRRDSQSRMVVTYYAIMLIDRANDQNNNYHGIGIKPAIDMLISEIEAGGGGLQRGDFYLDSLYSLKEKYQDQ
ncbi:MAG: hypothetical protein ABFR63_03070 [Thermodesulfobacteriota bacterium]